MMDREALIQGLFENPYATYQKLRSIPPIKIDSDSDLNTAGAWVFSKYEDVKQIFEEKNSISKNIVLARGVAPPSIFDLNMLNMDGRDHATSRRLVAEFFTNKNLIKLSSSIEIATNECLIDLMKKSNFDLVEEYAEIIPLKAILSFLGLPTQDSTQVRLWSLTMSPMLDSFQVQNSHMQIARSRIVKEISAYIQSHMQNPQELPDGSLLKHLCQQCDEGIIDEQHAVGAAILLLFAGHETTISLIGTSLYLLLSHSSQWDRICHNSLLIPSAIEEVLRFESPAQRSTFRVTTSPFMVGGVLLEPGQQIIALLGSANRDEIVFDNPDHFNIDRRRIPHFSFGAGSHVCLGQLMARMEAKIALEKISKTLPSIHLADTQIQWRKNSFFRQLEKLPIIQLP
jgi:cytochrome P450